MVNRSQVQTIVVALALIVAALAAWRLAYILLLALAAVLLAIACRRFASVLGWITRIPERFAVPLALILIYGSFFSAIILFGAQLAFQLGEVVGALPAILEAAEKRLGLPFSIASVASQQVSEGGSSLVGQFAGAGRFFAGAVVDFGIVAAASAYLALNPRMYVDGMLLLAPPAARGQVAEVMEDIGRAWSQWITAQAATMAIVGVLVGAGAALIGLPAPLALGLIAGLFEIIPVVGSIAGGAIPLLFAAPLGAETMLWTLALVVAVQQLEAALVLPYLQERMASTPSALALLALAAGGALFGPLGAILGVPIMIAVQVVVARLYVREVLEEEVVVPGETT